MSGVRDHSQATQRVKVGMIGLAVVVLLIGVASAIMRTATHEAPVGAIGSAKADVVANMTAPKVVTDASEPLAELGVPTGGGNQQAAASRTGR